MVESTYSMLVMVYIYTGETKTKTVRPHCPCKCRRSARTVCHYPHKEGYYSTLYKHELNGLMIMEMIYSNLCYGTHSYQISTKLNICVRFWSDVFNHLHQNTDRGNIFRRNGVPQHPNCWIFVKFWIQPHPVMSNKARNTCREP